jgi:hypothetical protein
MIRPWLLMTLSLAYLIGAEPADIKPHVLPTTLYCTVDYARRALVDIDVPKNGLSIRTTPDKLFDASLKVISPKQVEIRLRALNAGHGTLELVESTVDDQGKAIGVELNVLRRCDLQVIKISPNTIKWISHVDTLPDGSEVFEGELVLRPYVPGIDVRFMCLKPRNTVLDGLGERWIASETFTPIPSTGNGITSFRMVRPKEEKWVPYGYVSYQNGEQISQ